MAQLTISTTKILNNIKKIDSFLDKHNIQWSLITKIAGGNEEFLERLLADEYIKNLHSVGDARLSNLKIIKKLRPDIVTMYIKPPPHKLIESVVRDADYSLNSSYSTITELNQAAKAHGKIHKVVVMVELGELREGVVGENIVDFYARLFELENIEIVGLGTNLGCMYGIEPTYDKLVQLSLYKLLIEEKFKTKLPLITGGSSITLPKISSKFPKSINHLRIGETAFYGRSLLDGKKYKNLSTDTIKFHGEIIELEEKDMVPEGKMSDAGIGHFADIAEEEENKKSYRAIVDFGSIDVNYEDLTPVDESINFVGTTSDMTVYDLGDTKGKYKVGKTIEFQPNYMATARLMNSKYITKKYR